DADRDEHDLGKEDREEAPVACEIEARLEEAARDPFGHADGQHDGEGDEEKHRQNQRGHEPEPAGRCAVGPAHGGSTTRLPGRKAMPSVSPTAAPGRSAGAKCATISCPRWSRTNCTLSPRSRMKATRASSPSPS